MKGTLVSPCLLSVTRPAVTSSAKNLQREREREGGVQTCNWCQEKYFLVQSFPLLAGHPQPARDWSSGHIMDTPLPPSHIFVSLSTGQGSQLTTPSQTTALQPGLLSNKIPESLLLHNLCFQHSPGQGTPSVLTQSKLSDIIIVMKLWLRL